ncbi:hypothetical protein BN2475_280106 [Paraburkholderia ribeironis]|uniref:Uncharacterized protein n=1 Tax=Paraburkholderia ribeironis TaxID=1247936 RepID=A0A1N7S1M0_9BURK|nr:hypothetical protein BN2475_280106 [Paraburkholderia ribeironis]
MFTGVFYDSGPRLCRGAMHKMWRATLMRNAQKEAPRLRTSQPGRF